MKIFYHVMSHYFVHYVLNTHVYCIPFQIPYYGISICTDEQNESLYGVLDWDISIAVFDLVTAFI